jgi:hypothetical protein
MTKNMVDLSDACEDIAPPTRLVAEEKNMVDLSDDACKGSVTQARLAENRDRNDRERILDARAHRDTDADAEIDDESLKSERNQGADCDAAGYGSDHVVGHQRLHTSQCSRRDSGVDQSSEKTVELEFNGPRGTLGTTCYEERDDTVTVARRSEGNLTKEEDSCVFEAPESGLGGQETCSQNGTHVIKQEDLCLIEAPDCGLGDQSHSASHGSENDVFVRRRKERLKLKR